MAAIFVWEQKKISTIFILKPFLSTWLLPKSDIAQRIHARENIIIRFILF